MYAELGTTWWSLLGRPDEAAHLLGKLLAHVGEDNVLWGTDGVFYGSPQDQIQAFRAFQISEQFQEQFGYPALTDEIKRKVLGLNALRLARRRPGHRAVRVHPRRPRAAPRSRSRPRSNAAARGHAASCEPSSRTSAPQLGV